MKHYRIEPTYKKSVVEYRVFQKDNLMATQEIGWRWGEFIIHVPETEDELKEWCEYRGYESIQDLKDSYGLEEGEPIPQFVFSPEETDEYVELDDYDWEMISTWDGCWEYWSVTGPDLKDEEKEALVEEIEAIYYEEYENGLYEAGWTDTACYTEIHTQVSIQECDEGGEVYEDND